MIWDKLRYFNESENWGDAKKINGALLLVADELRHNIDRPIIILNAYSVDGHSDKSQHYTGNAIDFRISGMPFFDAYRKTIEILKGLQILDRVGFGVYPDTKFFHLDLRGEKARWSRIDGEYLGIEKAFGG